MEAYLQLQRLHMEPPTWPTLLDQYGVVLSHNARAFVLAHGKKQAGDNLGRSAARSLSERATPLSELADLSHELGSRRGGSGALASFQALAGVLPRNVDVLLAWAECAHLAGQWTVAKYLYEEVRSIPTSAPAVSAPPCRSG